MTPTEENEVVQEMVRLTTECQGIAKHFILQSGPSQNNFNRRSGHQQDIPSLLSQPMPLMDNDAMPSRQRGGGE